MSTPQEIAIQTQKVTEIMKILSHPKRFLILCKLREGPRTVGDLERNCTISQSQLSQFLSKMREEGILSCEKNGQFVSYSIADPRITQLVNNIKTIFYT